MNVKKKHKCHPERSWAKPCTMTKQTASLCTRVCNHEAPLKFLFHGTATASLDDLLWDVVLALSQGGTRGRACAKVYPQAIVLQYGGKGRSDNHDVLDQTETGSKNVGFEPRPGGGVRPLLGIGFRRKQVRGIFLSIPR